ncbi:MAG: gamma carbonic anhydrase family protein [Chloroflexi bacterium]|nr:MAG: gamma carbonic anhydrase family protein [Chloroflexota bacterium]TME56642.1 MAG: gamma carbonic anhydrase family protein [Chloroflexota bacterium]
MEFELSGKRPRVHPDAYIAPTAVLIGDVEVGAGASVWFGAVLRGDEAAITVGDGANVQDNAVLHCARNLPTVIERNASVGHSAQLEGCVVEQGAVVGMGATMLQRSRLGAGSMLAAGAVLGEGKSVPAGHMAAGVPATVKKPLDGSAGSWVGTTAKHYQDRAVLYRANLRPGGS